MRKSIIVLTIGLINTLYSLGLLIGSFNIETDEYGSSINSNELYLIWLITGILILYLGKKMFDEEKNIK